MRMNGQSARASGPPPSGLLALVERQSDRKRPEHATHDPALSAQPQRSFAEKRRDGTRGHDDGKIHREADRHLGDAEDQALRENISGFGMDELRKDGEVKD